MICPNCMKRVESPAGIDWLILVQSITHETSLPDRVARTLEAIRHWDKSQAYVSYDIDTGAQMPVDYTVSLMDQRHVSQTSAMPTELRDALEMIMTDLGLLDELHRADQRPDRMIGGIR